MSYVDVDKFAEKICNFQAIDEDAANAMIWLLRTFPTADVVEVRHGEWAKKDLNNPLYESKKAPYCSVCNYISFIRYDYCPNCGAKMDGAKCETSEREGEK